MYLWGYSQLGCKPIDMIFGSENERFTLPRQAGGTGYSPTALNLSKDWLQGRSVAHPGVLGGRGGIQTWECLAPRLKVLKTPSQNSRLESGKILVVAGWIVISKVGPSLAYTIPFGFCLTCVFFDCQFISGYQRDRKSSPDYSWFSRESSINSGSLFSVQSKPLFRWWNPKLW